MTRIGIFTGRDLRYFGGGERYAIELSKELIQRGIDVTIFSQQESKELKLTKEQIDQKTNAKIVPYRMLRIPYSNDTVIFSMKLVKELSPIDTIYCIDQSPFSNIFLQLYANITGKRHIFGMHTPSFILSRQNPLSPGVGNWIFKFYKFIARMLFNHVKNIHVINEGQKRDLIHLNYPGKIIHVPDFVYNSKSNLINNQDHFYVLSIGRLELYNKGIDLLKNVVEEALKSRADVEFMITGPPGDGKEIVEYLTKKYPENVKWLGFVSEEELENLFSISNLFVFTARNDSFSLSVVNAQCYGLPSVAFNISGPKDILIEKTQGTLVEPYSTNEFAKAIISYYDKWSTEKNTYFELRKSISDIIYEKFGKEVVVPQLIGMLVGTLVQYEN